MTKNLLLLFCVIIILSGCALSISLKDYNSIPKEERLVFGQIKALNMGKNPRFNIFIKAENSKTEFSDVIKDDGYFYWHLKPGKYIITHFGRRGIGRIWATFEVIDNSHITYIGTLNFMASVVSEVSIKNNITVAKEKLKNKFDLSELNIFTILMKKEGL